MQQPQIGDLLIRETAILPQTVSVIAQQTGNVAQPYHGPAGKLVGLLSMGQVTPNNMIHHNEHGLQQQTWIIRAATFVGMIIGAFFMMLPITAVADIAPLFASITRRGTLIIGFLLGLCLWSIPTAIACFPVEPLVSVTLVIGAALICLFNLLY